MRKILALVLTFTCLMTGLSGCGSDDSAVTETTIEVKKDGSVVHTIVEDFSEAYYSVDELKNMIQSACDSYNASAGADSVTVEEPQLTDGILSVRMKYRNAAAYAGFNKQALFVGTVKDAYSAGYDLDVSLVSLEDEDASIGREDILGMGEKHIAIVRESVDVKVWDKILYVSKDVIRTGNNRIVMAASDANSLTYIIFE